MTEAVVDVFSLVDEGLGNSAHVVDLGDGGALVVDPERDPRPYLGELERRGLAPRFVVETHLHADLVSGGDAGQPIGTTSLLDASAADDRAVLDIRQGSESSSGHLPGARHVELGELETGAGA